MYAEGKLLLPRCRHVAAAEQGGMLGLPPAAGGGKFGRVMPSLSTPAVRWDGHGRLDARSLALGELIARRLQEEPARLEVARAILARWQRLGAPNVQAALAEWQAILEAGLEATVATLTGRDERCVRLRQSAPFAGEAIVSRQERQALWRRFAPPTP